MRHRGLCGPSPGTPSRPTVPVAVDLQRQSVGPRSPSLTAKHRAHASVQQTAPTPTNTKTNRGSHRNGNAPPHPRPPLPRPRTPAPITGLRLSSPGPLKTRPPTGVRIPGRCSSGHGQTVPLDGDAEAEREADREGHGHTRGL